jgi:hypothetical protein
MYILTPPHFTTTLTNGGSLPSHHFSLVGLKGCLLQRLCQHVSHLNLCSYMIDAGISFSYLLPEVMVFDVQVFCPWSHFGYLGYLDGPFIILKDPAVDPAWLCIDCYSLCFNFLQEPHDGKNLSHQLG